MRFYFFLNSGCEGTGVFSPATQGGVQSHSQPDSASEDCVNVQCLLFYWTKKKKRDGWTNRHIKVRNRIGFLTWMLVFTQWKSCDKKNSTPQARIRRTEQHLSLNKKLRSYKNTRASKLTGSLLTYIGLFYLSMYVLDYLHVLVSLYHKSAKILKSEIERVYWEFKKTVKVYPHFVTH